MNLPILPTDNLYKFLALSGLAIIALCIVFPLQRIHDLDLKLIETGTKIKVLKLEQKYLQDNLINTLVNKSKLPPKQKAAFRKYLVEVFNHKHPLEKEDTEGKAILSLEEQATFSKALEEVEKKSIELGGQLDQANYLNKEFGQFIFVVAIGLTIGLILSSYGFLRWYYLIQKPNDMLLQKQIKNNKISP